MRQNALLSDIVFKIFSQVPASKISFLLATECIIKRPRFKKFLSSYNFRKHWINSVRKQHLASSFWKCYQQFQLQKHRCNTAKNHQFKSFSAVPTSKTSFQIASECTYQRPRFQKILRSFDFFLKKKFRRGEVTPNPDIFPISSKRYLATHANSMSLYD